MDSYEGRTEIADDLRRLGDVIRLNDEIPVHEFGPVDIMYCVIEGDHDEREARFNAHADDMQRIATEMGLGFAYASSVDKEGDTHHRATLTMPNKQVTYRVTWIERKAKAEAEPEEEDLCPTCGERYDDCDSISEHDWGMSTDA